MAILTLTLNPEIQLDTSLVTSLETAVSRAEKEVANTLLLLPEDVIITVDSDQSMIDPNIGVGGYTDDKNHIQLSIDPTHKGLAENELFATIVHELSHVKRAYGPWYGTTLFDYLVFEGLGVAFEEEVCGSHTYYPSHLRNLYDAKQLIESFAYMFDDDDTQYDYMDFVLGNEEKGIPEFAVYSMGLYIIDQYLARTGKKASELLLEPASLFRENN